MTRRSCSKRGAGNALRSTESRTRSRCWRSPNTICEVRTAFPFAAFRTKSDLLILPSPRVSQRRELSQERPWIDFDFKNCRLNLSCADEQGPQAHKSDEPPFVCRLRLRRARTRLALCVQTATGQIIQPG